MENRPKSEQFIIAGADYRESSPTPTSAEDKVAALLAFLSGMNNAWVRIQYKIFDDIQELTTESLSRDPNETELDHQTLLRQKAHELLCAEDVKISLINPDRPEKEITI